MKKTKILFVIVCLLMLFMPSSVSADSEKPNLTIKAHNITFKDSVYLKYAVSYENAEEVQMLIWNSEQDEYLYGTQDVILSSDGVEEVLGDECKIFTYTGLTAKQMTDNVYARAFAIKDNEYYYSEVDKYSILDYAYSKTGKTGIATTDEKLLNLLDKMLAYGSAAQEYYNGGEGYHLERLATNEYYQVKVSNGFLPDGFSRELFVSGTSITLTALAVDENGNVFDHWENSSGVCVGTETTLIISVGSTNEEYIAKYLVKPTASVGLEIEDGEISDIGTCGDEFVVLPQEYDGVTVTSISGSAFTSESFTSIYIPLSITSIGKNAFKGCTIEDVYYEGSEEQWQQISISSGNGPLTEANVHFNSYGPTSVSQLTVVFKDYDGTVLKSEKVNPGGSATPPSNPSREGYVFTGWQGLYSNVQNNTKIIAQYQAATSPVIVVSSGSVKAGDSFDVEVSLRNNPGIATSIIRVNYDDNILTLDSFDYGTSFLAGGELPQNLNSPVTLAWSSTEGNVSGDVTYAILHFTANANAQTGNKANVQVSYSGSDIINLNEDDVDFDIINGSITIQ